MLRRIRFLLDRSLIETLIAVAHKLGVRIAAPRAAHHAIFTRIYRSNEWDDPESRSGPGSTRARGAGLRPALAELLARHSIATLLDAPCGDFNWIRDLTAEVPISYTGVDIVEELIRDNIRRYADERHRFFCRDLTRDLLPKADLILCRDALVHFSFADIHAALANFKRSGSKYLLATSFIDLQCNEDIRTGGWRPLNLQAEPFLLPAPIESIPDTPPAGIAPGKRLCLWEL